MNYCRVYLTALAVVSLPGTSAHADLPNLAKDPWSNYFIGVSDRKILFGITTKAEGIIHPIDRRKEYIRLSNPIDFDFRVLEHADDGKVVRKVINFTSLESDQKAEVNPAAPITFRGKVTGDAAFSVTVAHDRAGYHFSGNITDEGSLEKRLEFGIGFNFDPYRGVDASTPDDLDSLEKMARRDILEIVTKEGEKVKFDIDDEIDLKEKFPEGVASIKIKTVRYDGTDFRLTATDGSKISFEEAGKRPVYKALKFLWTANANSDVAEQKLTLVVD